MPARRLAALFLVYLAGCTPGTRDGKPTDDTTDDTAPDTDTTPPDTDTVDTGERVELPPIGVVNITEWVSAEESCPSAEATVWGLYDRPPEPSLFGLEWEYWGEVEQWVDGCAIVTTIQGSCEPACAGDAICDQEGTCQPWPTHLGAGPITVGGLTVPMTLEHTSLGTYALTEVPPDDLFGDGSVTLDAPGDALPAFSVTARAPEPLDVDFTCDPFVTDMGDLHLTWTPQGGAMRVRLVFGGVQHGGAGYGRLAVCESDDDGELFVSAALLGGYGPASRYFRAALVRYSRGGVEVGAGEVRLEVGAGVDCTYPFYESC